MWSHESFEGFSRDSCVAPHREWCGDWTGGWCQCPSVRFPRGRYARHDRRLRRASRPIMIVASLRAGTHNHEQPAVRGKWEDHDTDWEGPRSSHWGPRGSSAPTRVTLATAIAHRVGSYVNTLNSPQSSTQYTPNDKTSSQGRALATEPPGSPRAPARDRTGAGQTADDTSLGDSGSRHSAQA